MASQSLSPPFHNYQCSPSAESHAGYSNSGYHHHHHRSEKVEKPHHASTSHRFRLSSLKGKSWSSFSEVVGCESSDDDTEATADEEVLDTSSSSSKRHKKRGSIVRLKKRDVSLYGHCPQTDPFSVVVCRHCRMVLKPPALKSHIDRQRHEKDRKHDLGDAVVKLEKLAPAISERPVFDKTSCVTEKFDKISVVIDKYEPKPLAGVQSFSGAAEKVEKLEKASDVLKRHRHFRRKSATPSENSNDAGVHFEAPTQTVQTVPSTTDSSSASNSPQPRRRKLAFKHVDEAVETFHNAPATCRIIVDPTEIVIRDASSPPPLAPITNEAAPSVWIVTPSPTVIIDGSFVVKPLEQEIEPEVDLKDLKVLKPLMKESLSDTPTLLTPSNWYATQPKPLTISSKYGTLCFKIGRKRPRVDN